MRVGFLVSHPIQYLSPLLRELATKVDLQVYYAHTPDAKQQADAGFGVGFEWDTDLLGGYSYAFLGNIASKPDARAGNFFGCDTPEIYDIIAHNKFDVFIVNGWYLKSFWQAVWACKRARIPVFVRGDSQLLTPRAWWKRLAKEVGYRLLLRVFDGFLSVGKRFDQYLTHYGVPSRRIFRAPHSVDNKWFARRARKALSAGVVQRLRSELDIPVGSIILLFAGKFIPVKRADDILLACRELERRNVNAHAVFVGSGPLSDRLKATARQLHVHSSFVGFKNQTELPAYYALADVLVLPSESETWGLVVNEAMACGTSAIVSKAVGCSPDLIIAGETGYTFPTGDVRALADAVQEFIAHRENGHDFEAAVREHINGYSIESAAEHIVTAVHAVAERTNQH